MWQSEQAGRWAVTDTVLWGFGHLLQRAALLPDLGSHLAQGLFSNSQHITATNHQCPCSSLGLGVCMALAKWSCPCSSLQRWHCQGLFILLLLLLQVSPKAFHCLFPQTLRDEDIFYIWYQYDNKKHEHFINESGIFSSCPPFFWKTHLHSLMQS